MQTEKKNRGKEVEAKKGVNKSICYSIIDHASIENHVKKVKSMLRFDGKDEMKSLFDHVGVVVEGYISEEAIEVANRIQQ